MTCPRCGSVMEDAPCPLCGFVPTPVADQVVLTDEPLTADLTQTIVAGPEPVEVTGPQGRWEVPTPVVFTPARPTKRHPVRRLLLVLVLILGAWWFGWPLVQPWLGTVLSQTTAPYPTVTAPPGSQECAHHGDGPYDKVATYNEITRCGLANNVWQAYHEVGLQGQDGTVTVTSPESGETYQMSCTGSQPVYCAGGETARVVIYGGQFTVG